MRNVKYEIKDKSGITGRVTITTLPIHTPQASRIDALLAKASLMDTEAYLGLLNQLRSMCDHTRQASYDNLVTARGREVLTRLLNGDTTYTGAITHGALGTGSIAPVAGNLALGTEVARKQIASRSRVGTTLTIDFYYSKSDTNGTYQEFGTFIDGALTADSGQLFNRVLTGGWTKSATEAMTISVQFDINPS